MEYVRLPNGQIVRKDTIKRWEVQRLVGDALRAALPNKLKAERRRRENRRLNRNANRKANDDSSIHVRVRKRHPVEVPVLPNDTGS